MKTIIHTLKREWLEVGKFLGVLAMFLFFSWLWWSTHHQVRVQVEQIKQNEASIGELRKHRDDYLKAHDVTQKNQAKIMHEHHQMIEDNKAILRRLDALLKSNEH